MQVTVSETGFTLSLRPWCAKTARTAGRILIQTGVTFEEIAGVVALILVERQAKLIDERQLFDQALWEPVW